MEPMVIAAAALVVYLFHYTAKDHISGLKEFASDLKELLATPCINFLMDICKAGQKMILEFKIARIMRAQVQKNLRT